MRGKIFGPRLEALCDVNLEVSQGEIVALMGPNGAGKSTLLRLIAGLLIPDGGNLDVLGQDVRNASAAFRQRVCYVVCDERSFSWRLSAVQNLEFFAALYDLHGERARIRIERALDMVELRVDAKRPVREYSTGMRHRLALARGLLGDPEIFLFDELTRGVDPLGAARLRRLILKELTSAKRTAIVATHDLTDVTQLCSRVIVLDHGRITGEGPPERATRLIGVEPEATGT